MSESTKYIKMPISAALFCGLFIASASFFLGAIVKPGTKSTANTTASSGNVFAVEKSEKPELGFYVMSFCPYGNQMETILKPVFDLIGDKADIRPHYIFEKVTDLKNYCVQTTGDPSQCAAYVQNKYFKDEAECKKVVTENNKQCNDEKSYIKLGDSFYTSLHGRIEANQDVREICAYNLTDDKKAWWNFVDNVNTACTAQDADTCWEEQAKKAGLDTNKITECFNKDGQKLIDQEIALTDKYKIQGSPTLLVNGVQFPPETAYTQDGKGSITVGNKVISQDKFRSPDAIKDAICSAFKKSPKACDTVLPDNTQNNAAAAAGGCGN
jgi:mRNA-degrading endonuclease HigB of HigAB toxin-antitoxin module